MRPSTLAEAIERIEAGEPQEIALAEFVDTFLLAPDDEARYAAIAQEPQRSRDARLNALAGAMAEYLAKHYRLMRVPAWVSAAVAPSRRALVHHVVSRPRHARVSQLREPGRIQLAQHLHRGTPVAPGAQPPAVRGQDDRAGRIPHDHRDRRTGRAPARARWASGSPPTYGLRHLDTGLIYRAVAKALLDAGCAPDDRDRAIAAAKALDPAPFRRESAEEPGGRRRRLDRLGDPRGAHGAAGVPARLRRDAAGRGARRPRHRHRDRARCRREDLRRRRRRRNAPAGAPPSSRPTVSGWTRRRCSPTSCGATSATAAGRWRRSGPRRMRTCWIRRRSTSTLRSPQRSRSSSGHAHARHDRVEPP